MGHDRFDRDQRGAGCELFAKEVAGHDCVRCAPEACKRKVTKGTTHRFAHGPRSGEDGGCSAQTERCGQVGTPVVAQAAQCKRGKRQTGTSLLSFSS